MGTKTRPELSEKNKYWINRHRYYELKHFCLQYYDWKNAYRAMNDICPTSSIIITSKNNNVTDLTCKYAVAKTGLATNMNLVEQAAKDTDPDLSWYILKAVTEDLSYTYLKTRLDMPCSKDTYYDRYRRFFWILNQRRD